MDRDMFTNLQQVENSNDISKMPYYACESKIQLSVSTLFDDD